MPKKIFALALAGLMFPLSLSLLSWGAEGEPIGSITAIEGEGYILRKGNIWGTLVLRVHCA